MAASLPHNMANFGILTAEIGWRVWATPAGFASWLHYFRDLINSIQLRWPRTFGWAAITLGIGLHSSLKFIIYCHNISYRWFVGALGWGGGGSSELNKTPLAPPMELLSKQQQSDYTVYIFACTACHWWPARWA